MASIAEKLDTQKLQPGDTAPAFTLPTDDGKVSLSDYAGKKNVVVYFYPKDDTPGCTKQACVARDLKSDFDKANTVVIGISKDSAASHGKFRSKYGLLHVMGADETGEVCEAYGAWGEKINYGKKYMGLYRNIYLIDKNGKLVKSWSNVKAEGSIERALEEAKKLL